eukprot:tig00021290_g19981.t1
METRSLELPIDLYARLEEYAERSRNTLAGVVALLLSTAPEPALPVEQCTQLRIPMAIEHDGARKRARSDVGSAIESELMEDEPAAAAAARSSAPERLGEATAPAAAPPAEPASSFAVRVKLEPPADPPAPAREPPSSVELEGAVRVPQPPAGPPALGPAPGPAPAPDPNESIAGAFLVDTLRGPRWNVAMFRDGKRRSYVVELPYPGCKQVPARSELKFYAVQRGIEPGIYPRWGRSFNYADRPSALAQVWRVPGFKGTNAQKFFTIDQAMDFMESGAGPERIPCTRPAGMRVPWA